MKFNIYEILIRIGFLSFFALSLTNSHGQKNNIICILVDDLGYGDLSCQGAKDIHSPNIDAISKRGMTFKKFYANSPVCSPSRAALLTGKYPDMAGVPGVIRQEEKQSWGYLDEKAIALPQVLKDADYHTAMIGKWHLGFEAPNTPNARGFDYFKGFLGDMMDDYWTHLRGGVNWMRWNEEIIEPENQVGHATDLFTDWAIDYLKEREGKQQPFFLYLAYNAPHFPIQPPQEWLDKVQQREKNISEKRAKNVALIEHLDFSISRIMKVLNETGLDDNTLVIFTSDNGGALPYAQSNGTLRGSKQEMYEGGIRVPMFAMWKGKIEPGSTSDNLGMLMDLFPTFCEVARTATQPAIDGISLLPTLMGENQATDDRYLFWVRREGWQYGGQAYYAARHKDYKILQNSAYEPLQFFNIEADEMEKTPLNPENNEIYSALRIALQEHIRKSGAIPWQKN
ncbi:MAG: sulfatase-like hydrolase/transferase [Phaeodactylibacter sp.]|nr:sulfatase-like hydrolase/transferase [Phaeodactylibacter sp.]